MANETQAESPKVPNYLFEPFISVEWSVPNPLRLTSRTNTQKHTFEEGSFYE